MDRYSKLKIFAASGFAAFLYDIFLTVKRIDHTGFHPLLPQSTYMLINKAAKVDDDEFFVYYSPNAQKYKVGYKICDENEWILDKTTNYALKVSKNNAAFDTYDEHEHTIVNKSFIVGKPIFALSGFKLFSGLDVDKSNFVIRKQETTQYDNLFKA